jgi:hypothetical protein
MSPRILTPVIFSLALAACQTTGGGCPPLVGYNAAQQQQAAKELRAMGKDAQLSKMIVDYKKMRDACRAGGAT